LAQVGTKRETAKMSMRTTTRRYLPSFLCLAAFAVLAVLVTQGVLVTLDRHLFLTWHTSGHWQVLLHAFNAPETLILLAILCLAAPRLRRPRALLIIGGALALLEGGELLGKLLLVQPAGSLPHTVLWWQLSYSFPSGHSLRAAFFLVLLGSLLPRILWPLLAAVGLFVGWGLVSAGAHYPSDVLGGLLLGLGVGSAAVRLLRSMTPQDSASTDS